MFHKCHVDSTEPSTSLKCHKMEDAEETTRLELSTVLDTVMLSALTTSNSSMEKLTKKDGIQANLTLTPELANTDLAAWSSTSGRLTASLRHSLPILAPLKSSQDAKDKIAVITTRAIDSRESAIRTDVILPPSETETRLSTDQEAISLSTLSNHSLLSLNSSLMTVPTPVRLLRSRENTSRTERQLRLHLSALMARTTTESVTSSAMPSRAGWATLMTSRDRVA